MRRAWLVFAILHATALFYAWDFTIDDAFIITRFTRNWLQYGSWGMNPHERGDGVTSPLFMVICAVPVWFGVPGIVAQKAVGAFAFVLAQALGVHRWLRTAALPAWMVPLLSFTGFGFVWAVGGLETGVAGLALTLALPRGERASRVVSQLATVTIPWLRPELAPLVLLFRLHDCRSNSAPALSSRVLPVALSVGALALWRLSMFGEPMPLAFYAKQGNLEHGVGYVVRSIPFAVPLLALARAISRPRLLHAAIGLLVASVSIAFAGGDWMPGQRLFQPVFQALFVWVGMDFEVAESGDADESRDTQRVYVYSALFAGFAWIVANAFVLLVFAVPSNFIVARSRLEPLRRAISTCSSVALVDAGFLVLDLDVRVVDLAGLTDRDVAHLPGGHLDKRVSLAFLRAHDVDCAVLHRGLARFPVEERLRRELRERDVSVAQTVVLSAGASPYSYQLYRL